MPVIMPGVGCRPVNKRDVPSMSSQVITIKWPGDCERETIIMSPVEDLHSEWGGGGAITEEVMSKLGS